MDPYVQGYREGRADAREDFERTVAILREENATLRRMLEQANQRGEALATELTRSLVVQPVPHTSMVPDQKGARPAPRGTTKDPIAGLGNVLDPVPFGDPNGMFSDARAASLMAVEDEDADGVSRAA